MVLIHYLSLGVISHGFTNFGQIFSQTHSFLKNQTQVACSNANKERISSMIDKKIKHLHFSIFELGTIVHYVIEDTYWCPISMEKTIRFAENSEKKNYS